MQNDSSRQSDSPAVAVVRHIATLAGNFAEYGFEAVYQRGIQSLYGTFSTVFCLQREKKVYQSTDSDVEVLDTQMGHKPVTSVSIY